MVKFVDDHGNINTDELKRIVRIAVRMMDNTIDASEYPLPQQKQEAHAKRRIGLGVTGLADTLAMCGIVYGSDEAAELTERLMKIIAHEAAHASIDLAQQKGAFPLFDPLKYYNDTVPELADDIRERGIRNSLLTSIAPTGTISLYAGNVSSGIEPVFAKSYTRKVLENDGSHRVETVTDYAVALGYECVTAQDIDPMAHVKMQAAAQKYVDNAISKTINCPADIDFEAFKDVYMQAYDSGCKGCTTYRPNDVTGSVLTALEEEGAACMYDPETGERSCSG